MSRPKPLFDRPALWRARQRALNSVSPAVFLHELAAHEISERLNLVNKSFSAPILVTPSPDPWRDVAPWKKVIADRETLSLEPCSADLVIHGLALHWANDPVGQLIQCRRALQPDGLFMAVLFGGQTLSELRASLAAAEAQITGGLSPRVAPMAEIRDLGGLLQRAGLALPVADSLVRTVKYDHLFALMADLRAMGETNVLVDRPRCATRRGLFTRAAEIYQETHPHPMSGICATFDMIYLTGWAPHESQQKPLKPGSAIVSMADALSPTTRKWHDSD